jgi:hypothetical protein
MATRTDGPAGPETTRCDAGLRTRLFIGAALGVALAAGCGGDDLSTRVVSGKVTVGGQPIEAGQIRFVPIRSTSGPASLGQIVGGQYRIEARGGVPVGTHRVEIIVYGQPGWDGSGFEPGVPGPEPAPNPDPAEARRYGGRDSPLEAEVKPTGDARFNFDVPVP